MTDRQKISEQLSAYLDGELSDAERKKVQHAVRSDRALAAELRRLRSLRKLLGGLPREQAGDLFVENVLAQAERRNLVGPTGQAQAGARLSWVRWVAAAAVLMIVVGVGVVVTVTLSRQDFSQRIAREGRAVPTGQIARDVTDLADKKLPSVGKVRARKGRPAPDAVPPGSAGAVRTALGEKAARRKAVAGARSSVAAKEAPARRGTVPKTPNSALPLPLEAPAPIEHRGLTAAARPIGEVSLAGPVPPEARELHADVPAARPGDTRAGQAVAPNASPAVKALTGAERRPLRTEIPAEHEVAYVPAEFASARSEVVFTDDLAQARRDIEKLLEANDVVPLVVRTGAASPVQARPGRGRRFARPGRPSPTQVQYLAYVTPAQMDNVIDQLGDLRRGQRVPQAPAVQRDELVVSPSIATRPAATARAAKPWIAVEEKDGKLRLKPPGRAEPRPVFPLPFDYAGRAGLAMRPGGRGMSRAEVAAEPLLITLNFRRPAGASGKAETMPSPTR